ncbi:MAG: hypothetical protein M3O21_01690 [Chloroflexota bacterium]|nr:hypothetical protein [Chloroflexota bacterium]
MPVRLPAALVPAVLAALLLLRPSPRVNAQQASLLQLTSTVTYDVKTTDDGAVHVTWDATLTDNDPATGLSGNGTVSYYYQFELPVLRGADSLAATDSAGNELQVKADDPGGNSIDEGAVVQFARRLFYGQTYSFRLTYRLSDSRSQGVLVTPYYAYVPAIAAGDQATVVVNTPATAEWTTDVEARDCPQTANTFACSGSGKTYLAALVEVSQPGATASTKFDVPLKDKTVSVTLTYFLGEDATAQHEQQLIGAGLPVIEQVYGFDYAGPAAVNITQGGRQSSLGYEGLGSCTPDVSCDIVISPVAGDYTLLHELSHMWSSVYAKRWLSEGFAEFVAEATGPQLPPGLVVGDAPQRSDPVVSLALNDWGDANSLVGANAPRIDVEGAGYTFSLRFLQTMRDQFGLAELQTVNHNIATGTPADSRRYMDVLEEATGDNLDSLFLTWVFPTSYKQTLADRRTAINRLSQLRTRLSDAGLPDDTATPIQADVRSWDFASALTALDRADDGLETYASLRGRLDMLEIRGQAAGLTVPAGLTDKLNHFDFDTVRPAIDQANEAVMAYSSAQQTVDGPHGIWKRFGLLGGDPGGALRSASDAFANGDFELSRQQSQHASDLINGASSVAFRRLLVVAGFVSLLVLALAVAFVVSHLRERELVER